MMCLYFTFISFISFSFFQLFRLVFRNDVFIFYFHIFHIFSNCLDWCWDCDSSRSFFSSQRKSQTEREHHVVSIYWWSQWEAQEVRSRDFAKMFQTRDRGLKSKVRFVQFGYFDPKLYCLAEQRLTNNDVAIYSIEFLSFSWCCGYPFWCILANLFLLH